MSHYKSLEFKRKFTYLNKIIIFTNVVTKKFMFLVLKKIKWVPM